MGQPLSMDLRTRLLAAIDAGMSCRSAAVRFGVAPSTAIRWQARRRTPRRDRLCSDTSKDTTIGSACTQPSDISPPIRPSKA